MSKQRKPLTDGGYPHTGNTYVMTFFIALVCISLAVASAAYMDGQSQQQLETPSTKETQQHERLP